MGEVPAPTSADHAVIHLVSWLALYPGGAEENRAMMLGCLRDVLPRAAAVGPWAEVAGEFLAAGDDPRAVASACAAARPLMARFHAGRAGSAWETFRKGAANA